MVPLQGPVGSNKGPSLVFNLKWVGYIEAMMTKIRNTFVFVGGSCKKIPQNSVCVCGGGTLGSDVTLNLVGVFVIV